MDGVTLVEGQTLLHDGRYRFLRRIGSGTFATILWCVSASRPCSFAPPARRLHLSVSTRAPT